MAEKLSFEEAIQHTLDSGIQPLIMNAQPIYSCDNRREIAYRTELVFNSMMLGVLHPDDYYIAAMKSERGLIVADRSLMYTCRAIKAKLDAKENFDFISTRFPYSTFTQIDIVDVLRRASDDDDQVLSHLCVEFPYNTLYHNMEIAAPTLTKLKNLKINTMISDFGDAYCPVMRLADFPFTHVMLSENATLQMRDEKKSMSVDAMVGYIIGMGAKAIATGIESEDEVDAFNRDGCYGFCRFEEPKQLFDYGGSVDYVEN